MIIITGWINNNLNTDYGMRLTQLNISATASV